MLNLSQKSLFLPFALLARQNPVTRVNKLSSLVPSLLGIYGAHQLLTRQKVSKKESSLNFLLRLG